MALSSVGSLFQTQGPAAEKAQSPSLSLVDCLTRSLLLAEWFEAETRHGCSSCEEILQVDRCPSVDD